MNTSTRNGGIAGLVAGLGYIVQAILGLIRPQTEVFSSTSDYILEVVFIIALICTLIALIGLRGFLGNRAGTVGTLGFWLTPAGTILMTISAMATLLAGQNSLGLAFLGGMLLAIVGYPLLGVAFLRTETFPRLYAAALIAAFPLSVFLSTRGGGVLFGLAWLATGYSLLRK
jgi:hypothetical protein